MRFVCLGYYDEDHWGAASQAEQNAFVDECLAYDDVLREDGRFAGGEALDGARNARTVRFRNGKAVVTDGPYAETKEQIGGFLLLEAEDFDAAVGLISKHPGVKGGPFEIRAVVDMSDVYEASRKRRAKVASN